MRTAPITPPRPLQLVSACTACHQVSLHYIVEIRRMRLDGPHYGAIRECPECSHSWYEQIEEAP